MNDRFWFRGKNVNSGRLGSNRDWVIGSLIYKLECEKKKIVEWHFIEKLWTPQCTDSFIVDPATIGQCTGLRDKNGVLIFEGDIVTAHYGATYGTLTGVIVWDEKYCAFAHDKGNGSLSDLKRWAWSADAIEIIGNVHDSPELLKGTENNDKN